MSDFHALVDPHAAVTGVAPVSSSTLVDRDWSANISGTHVNSDGSQIGGTDPVSSSAVAIPGDAVLMTISGSKTLGYASWMAYWQRPVYAGFTGLELCFQATFDDLASENGQAWETDTILVLPGATLGANTKINLSSQLNIALGWQWQIVMGGKWMSVPGAILGPLDGGKHKFRIGYEFTKTTGMVTSLTVDGKTYFTPPSMQKADVTATNWTPYATFQAQQDLNAAAKNYSVIVGKPQYRWSS